MTGYVDGNGAAWGFTYDAMNRAVTMTDPLGNVTSNSYDANGNLTSKTAADGGVTAYTLDGVGNLQQVLTHWGIPPLILMIRCTT